MNNILIIFWIVLAMYVLFETEAFVKWAKLFKLKFLKYEEFEEKAQLFNGLKYTDFLLMKYNNFFINLLACQECLTIWVNIFLFLFFANEFGGWFFFGVNTVLSLIGIAYFKYLLKKWYE